ncbi:hypothetical protein Acsp04_45070 [Actinomadura sp. NBRC 104425]|uniref:hypothetical protein n=1 Tax=Actinomadura sp. NBRC 104425 TaxID=3032204 RepID=UPI0024A56CC7|nr:hypothetical protein [Actinomadura sp. NBRC 104425]GLZ14272.1 hypothetical protein Acsp04_45070 [Actinomadura sp. NBRC 104425]
MPPALAGHRSRTRELLTRRLAAEFTGFSPATVARCVADVQACLTHLGLDATPELVERMAREHLVGMVKSRPPSGRGDTPSGTRRPRLVDG